jgi:hypothetical protein
METKLSKFRACFAETCQKKSKRTLPQNSVSHGFHINLPDKDSEISNQRFKQHKDQVPVYVEARVA